jgi:hypothetical protein
LTVSRFGPFNFAETAPDIQYIGRWMYLKTSGLDAVAKKMSVARLGNATTLQVVASQYTDLDIPAAPDRAAREREREREKSNKDYAWMIMQFVFFDVRLQLDILVEETVNNLSKNFCKFEALTFTGVSE